jgi:FAD/FMN-containing dehydrogenase
MSPLFAWPRYGTESLLTLEILLSRGDMIKTGTAALPIFNEKPFFPVFTPPGFLNKIWFGTQGTFGVATKAVVKLKTVYDNNEVVFIPFDSFPQCLGAVREIERIETGIEFFIASSAYLASMLTDNKDEFEEFKKSLPPATAVIVLRGEEKRVNYQKRDLANLSNRMNFKITDTLPGVGDSAQRILSEIDLPFGYERFKRIKGEYLAIPFICMSMQVPIFDHVVGRIAGAFGYNRSDIGEFLLPVEPSRFHYHYSFYTNPEDPRDYMKVKALFDVLSENIIKMGGFFSRPYSPWAEKVYDKASGYKTMIKELKAVVDPDNIMNPGKLSL